MMLQEVNIQSNQSNLRTAQNSSDKRTQRQLYNVLPSLSNCSLRFYTSEYSDNAVHSLRNEVANEAETKEASRNCPEPLEVVTVLTGYKADSD
jgi:hypothetical protein